VVGASREPSSGRRVVPIHSIPSSVAQALGEELYKLLLYNTRRVAGENETVVYCRKEKSRRAAYEVRSF